MYQPMDNGRLSGADSNEPVFFAHPTAVIDEGAEIGAGTKIWHFSHVSSRARIGRHCSLGQNVYVANNVRIGNGVKIQNNVSIYEGVELEDHVFCGPSMVFTNVRTPRSAFPRNTSEDYLPTRVKHGASIGANATVVCGVTIGEWAFIVAGAVVTKDVPPYALVAGVPGRRVGWACKCGATLSMAGTLGQCAACDRRYEQIDLKSAGLRELGQRAVSIPGNLPGSGTREGSRPTEWLKSHLLRYRATRRVAVWLGILRRLRGVGPLEQFKLVLSAALDIIFHAVHPSSTPSPKVTFASRLYAPALDASFYVRAGTDDVYNVLPFGELDVHHAILDPLSPGDVFVDVGANIGYYTVLGARRVGLTGKVVAVEAMPATAEQLSKNLAANSIRNVEIVRAAAYDGSAPEVELLVPSNVFGMAAIGGRSRGENVTGVRVRATTLDEICAPFSRISVMKLDIEGSELATLTGASTTLAKTERLVIETNCNVEAIKALLRKRGFDLTDLSFENYIVAFRRTESNSDGTLQLAEGEDQTPQPRRLPQAS